LPLNRALTAAAACAAMESVSAGSSLSTRGLKLLV
jgi:hypothetical protein